MIRRFSYDRKLYMRREKVLHAPATCPADKPASDCFSMYITLARALLNY